MHTLLLLSRGAGRGRLCGGTLVCIKNRTSAIEQLAVQAHAGVCHLEVNIACEIKAVRRTVKE